MKKCSYYSQSGMHSYVLGGYTYSSIIDKFLVRKNREVKSRISDDGVLVFLTKLNQTYLVIL